MTEGTHTPGEWAVRRSGFSAVYVPNCLLADTAELLAEARAVRHETSLTPRQLVEQRDALVHALEAMTGFCDEHADFRNGETDPTGAIDEGNARAAEYFSIARAALALVKGEPK